MNTKQTNFGKTMKYVRMNYYNMRKAFQSIVFYTPIIIERQRTRKVAEEKTERNEEGDAIEKEQ